MKPSSHLIAVCLAAAILAESAGPGSVRADEPGPVDFDTQIMPILTRAGCNAGACHGAAAGRGGLHLSLYGSRPADDYVTLALEHKGRRVDIARPDASLLLLKPTESLSHGGGQRFEPDSPAADMLRRWIAGGAIRAQERQLRQVELQPATALLPTAGMTLALRVFASFDDGKRQDVTQWSTFAATDPAGVHTEDDGTITALRSGQHTVIVRYLDRILACEVLVPFHSETGQRTDAEWQKLALSVESGPAQLQTSSGLTAASIDQQIDERVKLLGLETAPPCRANEFLRRLKLRLTGRLPSLEELHLLPAQADAAWRAEQVEKAINSEDFVVYTTHRLSQLLQINSQPQNEAPARAYYVWLREQVADDTSIGDLVKQLLTAQGDTHTPGPAAFYLTHGDPRLQGEFVAEALMGIRMRCANCHDHPLDRWSQDDYHGLSAIFAQRRAARVITAHPAGQVIHPATGEPAVPRLPGYRFLNDREDGPAALAQWLTTQQGGWLDRAIVNRLWQWAHGQALVEPVEDLRGTNPASHSRLLEELAYDFAQNGRSIRHTLRLICLTETFNRSSRPPQDVPAAVRFYSSAVRGPIPPAVLSDAMSDVTAIHEPFGNEPTGTRAIELFAGNVPSAELDVLGRCGREDNCGATTTVTESLPLLLHLINGPLLNQRLQHPPGRVRQLAASETGDSALIEEFYLRALSRRPEPVEERFWQQQFSAVTSQAERITLTEDFVWSLLVSEEFRTIR